MPRAGTSVGTRHAGTQLRKPAGIVGRILLRALIRTAAFALLLLAFHAGYMTHGLVLDIQPTAPPASASHP